MRAFVTGGSSGIGLALAKALARRGDDVWICGLDDVPESVEAIRAEARDPSQRIGGVVLDVSDRAQVEALAPRVLEGLGGLDLLINDAGIACVATIEDETPEHYERMMAVNYLGTVWVTRAFVPHFVAQKGGRIVCVASTLGLVGLYAYTAYAASKFAVVGFCECLRQDLEVHGIAVQVLVPADVDTPQLRANEPHKPAVTKALAGTARLVTPEFIAEQTLEGIEHGSFLIVPGGANRRILWINRMWPGLVRAWIDGRIRRYFRR